MEAGELLATASAAWSSPEQPIIPNPIANARAALVNMLEQRFDNLTSQDVYDPPQRPGASRDALLVLLPLLIILSSLLFLLLLFLVCVLLIRRRRGIILRDSDGPIDLSREDLIEGEGGFDGVEERWLESVSEDTRRAYRRAKGELQLVTLEITEYKH